METLIAILEKKGYGTGRESWERRLWYSADTASILEIITGNAYARITRKSDGSFRMAEYVSTDYPMHPKTEFYLDPFRQELKTYDEVTRFVQQLGTSEQKEAA